MNAETFPSVWDALADTPSEAENMRLRAELLRVIADHIAAQGWTQAEAARHCDVPELCINDLMRGRLSRFSLDDLVDMATNMGWRVSIDIA